MGKVPTYAATGRKIPKWETLRITSETAPNYFNGEPQNIGILLGEPSSGLIDVDLDCVEAIAIANVFLPRTRTFGRASTPTSHWLYVATDAQSTMQLRDPNLPEKNEKKTIVELRANGAQTVIFGVHPSGETIVWTDETTEIASASWADLKTAVHRIGAASLLSRYWPGAPWQGPAAHALFGALLDAKWEHDDAWTFVNSVLRLANAPVDLDDDDARSSRGLSELAELMTSDIEKRALAAALAWIGLAAPSRSEGPAIDPEDEPAELAAVDATTRVQWFTAYLGAVPVEASNDGSGQLVKLAAIGVRGFALGMKRADLVLWTWAQRNNLRWSQTAIYKRCEDVMRGPRGGAPLAWGCKILERLEREKNKSAERTWEDALVKDERGDIVDCTANVIAVLTHQPEWKGVVRLDEFRQTVTLSRQPPMGRPANAPLDWTDTDDIRFQEWMQREHGFEPSRGAIADAVAVVAEQSSFHPVREYLAGLGWDGEERLPTMLANYFGAKPNAYTAGIGTMWMISAVARVMRPGCQADYMLVLESEKQGLGKSTGLRALCPDEKWFSDTGIVIGSKDSYLALVAKWIYEFGELDAIKGSEITKTKNFLSASSDSLRPPYGRRNRDFPRQCVFGGSTNETSYLKDRTGNRRFWPVRCTKIDVEAIRRDRDQLWAEARVRYERGERWWPDAALAELCAGEQGERLVSDPWTDIVAAWMAHPTEPSTDAHGRPTRDPVELGGEGITSARVLVAALGKRPGDITRADEMRLAEVLRDLGWTQTKRAFDPNGRRVRLWTNDAPTSKQKDGAHEPQ